MNTEQNISLTAMLGIKKREKKPKNFEQKLKRFEIAKTLVQSFINKNKSIKKDWEELVREFVKYGYMVSVKTYEKCVEKIKEYEKVAEEINKKN